MRIRVYWPTQSAISALAALATIVVLSLGIVGCSYSLKYSLNKADIRKAPATSELRVAVLALDDQRDPAERVKQARKERGDKDAGDFTCDKDFSGQVGVEVSKMIAKHLDYAGSFAQVDYVVSNQSLTQEAVLKHLRDQGYDAVLTGSLNSFTGYYDRNSGREMLLTAGLPLTAGIIAGVMSVKTETKSMGGIAPLTFTETTYDPIVPTVVVSVTSLLGNFIESSSARDISWQTALKLRLTQLDNRAERWSDSIVVADSVHTSMPGIKTGKRKQEVAVASLREAVNVLVDRLAAAPIHASTPVSMAQKGE